MMRGDDKEARMANAMAVVAGRAARPCDVCARKRSRWYCAADEAYLCEGCDSSVHAANALALRHERVRLAPNGAPMKINRRINSTDNPSSEPKKKLKSGQSAPSSRTNATAAYHNKYLSDPTHLNANGHSREVKKESNSGFNSNIEIDPSDDHFTAEELTGNANLLDDTPSMPPHHHSSSSHPGSNVISEGDFARFLVSDPNDPNNCANWEGDDDRIKGGTPTGSAGEGDVVDDEDLDDGDVGDDWMELDANFSYRDATLSDSSDYCIDHVALRGSASAAGSGGAFDQSLAVYSHDEKPDDAGSCGLQTASSKMGKPFKNIAGHSEWVKQEEEYPNYEQTLSTNTSSITTTSTTSACKIELSESEIKQLPSLKLNFDDVLISWQDRDIHWSDDGSSQLVPGDNSNSDAVGSCYDLGLVPDLSSAGYGVDAHGRPTPMYGGCCPGSMGAGGGFAGEDGIANAGNAREVRVNRYREKRRTRLFSKKIRYEVRKLNAERRPRMKGRFVKRSPGRET